MKSFKKIIAVILSFIVIFATLMSFNKSLLNISIIGVENVKATVEVSYNMPFYTCKLNDPKDMYDIHEELNITCQNNIISSMKYEIKHEIFGEIFDQYSSSYGAICNLSERWNKVGLNKITAIFQKSDPDKPKYGSSYYIVVEEKDGYKAYREDYVFTDEKAVQYVCIKNGMIYPDLELIEIGEVDRHDFREFAESQGYKLLTQNYVYGIKC